MPVFDSILALVFLHWVLKFLSVIIYLLIFLSASGHDVLFTAAPALAAWRTGWGLRFKSFFWPVFVSSALHCWQSSLSAQRGTPNPISKVFFYSGRTGQANTKIALYIQILMRCCGLCFPHWQHCRVYVFLTPVALVLAPHQQMFAFIGCLLSHV